MEATLDEAEETVAASDVEWQMMLDRQFHRLLHKAAKNEVLAELLQGLHDRSLRFWFISLHDRAHHLAVQAEHRARRERPVARLPADAVDVGVPANHDEPGGGGARQTVTGQVFNAPARRQPSSAAPTLPPRQHLITTYP